MAEIEPKPEVKPEPKAEPKAAEAKMESKAKPEMKNNAAGLANKMEKKSAKEGKKPEKKSGHRGFMKTVIDHHENGSHTIHHMHKDGEAKDVKHAVESMDGVHDSLEQNVGMANPSMGGAAPMNNEPAMPAPAAGVASPNPGM